jgi:hypothetical protein
MDCSDPPWLLNQSQKLMLSRFLTSFIPPSGSMRERTTGLVPRARALAALSATLSWGVVKKAFRPERWECV